MAWSAPATAVAGTTATAAWFNQYVRDNLKAIGDPWTAYTPTITNVTSSTLTAKYVAAGKWVTVRFVFTLTAAPTGTVTLSLPVTATTSWGTGLHVNIGHMTGLRQGTGYRVASVYQASSTTAGFLSDGTLAWTTGVPVAWANTDIWSGELHLRGCVIE